MARPQQGAGGWAGWTGNGRRPARWGEGHPGGFSAGFGAAPRKWSGRRGVAAAAIAETLLHVWADATKSAVLPIVRATTAPRTGRPRRRPGRTGRGPPPPPRRPRT